MDGIPTETSTPGERNFQVTRIEIFNSRSSPFVAWGWEYVLMTSSENKDPLKRMFGRVLESMARFVYRGPCEKIMRSMHVLWGRKACGSRSKALVERTGSLEAAPWIFFNEHAFKRRSQEDVCKASWQDRCTEVLARRSCADPSASEELDACSFSTCL